jgi:diguanylate cyclase (GGDEF)-like protein
VRHKKSTKQAAGEPPKLSAAVPPVKLSPVARAGIIGVVALAGSALLVLRSISAGQGARTLLTIAAVALSALPAAWGVTAFVLSVLRRRAAARVLLEADSLFLGALVIIWSSAICAVDIFLGRSPTIFVCGAVLVGTLYWNKVRLIVLYVLPASVVVLAAMYLSPFFGVEGVTTVLVADFLCFAAALVVRKDTMPGEERLRSLEAENRELWNLSFRDGLTGLYNRRFATESGQTMFTRANRYHEQLHVLMIDIDHFKAVNDKLGHPVGDEVLKGVADVIKANVRGSDIAARYGGEEFIIFVMRSEPELVQFIANRIRDGIATHAFQNVPWQITVSIGIAGLQPDDTLEELVDRSDKFLYLSKHSGRNRVSGY